MPKLLISDEYKSQLKQKHESPDWGTTSHQWGPIVSDIINKTGISEVLDYGCGKGTLGPSLEVNHRVRVHLYDPGIEKLDVEPDPRDLVVCTDVLEHIEPDLIDNVLDDLRRVTKDIGFFVIATGPAVQTLPDGRNAHLIQESYKWWLPKLWERFEIQSFTDCGYDFWVIVK